MRILRTALGTDFPEKETPESKLPGVLRAVIPVANLGYETKLHLVKSWLIEFDDEGLPDREIGLDADGEPVLAGPNAEDYGFWLDSNMKYEDFEGEPESPKRFEELWEKASTQGTYAIQQ